MLHPLARVAGAANLGRPCPCNEGVAPMALIPRELCGIGNDLLRIWPATDREATHDRRSQVQVLPPHGADRLLRDRDSIFRWLGSPLCQRIANARAAQRRLEARAASEEPSCQAC